MSAIVRASTRRGTWLGIHPDARSAYVRKPRSTKLSDLIAAEESRRRLSPPNSDERRAMNISEICDAPLVSRRFSTWLNMVARSVENAIHDCLSSIIWSRAKRQMISVDYSPTDSAGDPSDFELRLENAVYFAPTATDFILRNNWNTMAIRMSGQPSATSMPPTISKNDIVAFVEGLESGKIDYSKVTVHEWMQVSFLMLVHGNELHIDQQVLYGGSVYQLHACVEKIDVASGVTEQLGTKQ